MRENITFLTPLIFLARFLLSFICFLDFSTFVANPFCEQHTQTTSKQEYLMNITRGTMLWEWPCQHGFLCQELIGKKNDNQKPSFSPDGGLKNDSSSHHQANSLTSSKTWRKMYPDEAIFGLKFLGSINTVINEAKSCGLATSKLSAESKDENRLRVTHIINLWKFLL